MAELKNLSCLADLLIGKRRLENGRIVNDAPPVDNVYIPLAVIARQGPLTVMASSLLPIDGDTLKYGSPDGGKTVHDGSEDLQIKSKAERIALELSLKTHDVCTGKKLALACDCEIHRGRDGRIWFLDAARLIPCNPPIKKGEKKYVSFSLILLIL